MAEILPIYFDKQSEIFHCTQARNSHYNSVGSINASIDNIVIDTNICTLNLYGSKT